MRIDKFLEQQNIGSKKTVKRLFQRKLISVDGEVVQKEALNIDPVLHNITVNGQRLVSGGHAYYLLNKPRGTVTAVKDAVHQTVLDLISEKDRNSALYPVGRLDRDTEGLLLITDNGQLGYQLIQPKKKVIKRYEVTVNEALTEEDCQRFLEGITFTGGTQCQPAVLTILSSSSNESRAYLDIQEGKFHQVKKMFLAVGKKVTFLKRISMGPLKLDETMRPGEYRRLTEEELKQLLPYF